MTKHEFFKKNKHMIENLRTEKEMIDYFGRNNFIIDKFFLNKLKLNYNNSNNTTKLNNSQLENIAGGNPPGYQNPTNKPVQMRNVSCIAGKQSSLLTHNQHGLALRATKGMSSLSLLKLAHMGSVLRATDRLKSTPESFLEILMGDRKDYSHLLKVKCGEGETELSPKENAILHYWENI